MIHVNQTGIEVEHHSFKKEMALAIVPAVISIAIQSIFEGISSHIQHKREEKRHQKELEAQVQQEPTEEQLAEMEEEATAKLRVVIREEVINALKEVLVVEPPKQDPSRSIRKVKRSPKQ
jgi:uncharacterized membrane protein YhiD involved in acid resistance